MFKHNTIEKTEFMQLDKQPRPAFQLTDCTRVDIRDNHFSGTIRIKDMTKKDLTTDLPIELIK